MLYLLGQEVIHLSCGATRLDVPLSYAHSLIFSACFQKSIQFHVFTAFPPSAALCKKGMKPTYSSLTVLHIIHFSNREVNIRILIL